MEFIQGYLALCFLVSAFTLLAIYIKINYYEKEDEDTRDYNIYLH